MFVQIISAVAGGITDLSFHAVGYTWQTLNCFLTASYSVLLFLMQMKSLISSCGQLINSQSRQIILVIISGPQIVTSVCTASSIFSCKGVQHLLQLISYSFQLTLRHVMDSAKQATKSGNLNELSMVLLNNILSLPLGIILVLGFNEVDYLLET